MAMLKFTEILDGDQPTERIVTLKFEQRQKSRLRINLDSGEEAGFFFARGTVLRDGDRLGSDCGLVVTVKAAAEEVSIVSTSNVLLLSRACYHLGNRHVAIQIGEASVRYLRDHVLDNMLLGLGLQPTHQTAPFESEAGAYHGHPAQQHSHSAQHEH